MGPAGCCKYKPAKKYTMESKMGGLRPSASCATRTGNYQACIYAEGMLLCTLVSISEEHFVVSCYHSADRHLQIHFYLY